MTKRYSSVWAVIPEAMTMLRSASWPKIPQTSAVKVEFGALAAVPAGEVVFMSGSTQRSDQEIVTGGTPGKDDKVETQITISINIPGFTAEKTWDRLAELGRVVDDTFRDLETGKPIITDTMQAAGVTSIWIRAAETAVVPMNAAGANSWVGLATFNLGWQARI